MPIDLTQFHDAFFDESFEALDSMESALLRLDTGRPDQELINTIFRAAHSIKGGSSTFGFAEIASFTHSLETLLGEVREQRLAASRAIADLLLRSVDTLRAMLGAAKAGQSIAMQPVTDLQFDIELIIVNRDTAPESAPVTRGSIVEWVIELRPGPEFLARGADPVRIFRELAVLGTLEVCADLSSLPRFADMLPQRCYLNWSLRLFSDAPESAIREVFEWMNADCDLTIAARSGAASMDAMGAVAAPTLAPAPEVSVSPLAAAARSQEPGSIRVGVEKLDELINIAGELVITHAMLSQISTEVTGPAADRLHSGMQQLERNMRQLQDSVMRARMLPISVVFSRLPRMVRDLAQRLDKEVEMTLGGEATEVDKTVLERIGDPLMHLVRNCVDHGIERSPQRIAAGKPSVGRIHLQASHRGGSIVIEVRDDGKGLDHARITARARTMGLIGANESPSLEEAQELIFRPGFSTAEKMTDISGRGVGMDVVRSNIADLNGKIEVHSESGRGTRFVITLPLTLAIVDGLLMAVGEQTYVVPMMSTIESLRLAPGQVTHISDGREVFVFRDEYLPIVRLYQTFGLPARTRTLHEGLVVVVEAAGRRIGLFVDDLLSQQQVVIKSLATHYGRVPGVAAATILGDGAIALILDVADLIRIASHREAA